MRRCPGLTSLTCHSCSHHICNFMYLPFHLTQWWVLFMLCSAEVEDRTLCLLLPLDKHAISDLHLESLCVYLHLCLEVQGWHHVPSSITSLISLCMFICVYSVHYVYMHIDICVHAQESNCMWKPEAGARPLISLLFVYWDMVSRYIRGSCFLYCRAGSVEQLSSWMVCA